MQTPFFPFTLQRQVPLAKITSMTHSAKSFPVVGLYGKYAYKVQNVLLEVMFADIGSSLLCCCVTSQLLFLLRLGL